MERLQSEVTRYKNLQLKSAKDCEKYKEERDSVFNEYRLIMSERDQVIKELDKLQTELEAAEARLKNTSSERVVASEELEALRQVSLLKTCTTLHIPVWADALLIKCTVCKFTKHENESLIWTCQAFSGFNSGSDEASTSQSVDQWLIFIQPKNCLSTRSFLRSVSEHWQTEEIYN